MLDYAVQVFLLLLRYIFIVQTHKIKLTSRRENESILTVLNSRNWLGRCADISQALTLCQEKQLYPRQAGLQPDPGSVPSQFYSGSPAGSRLVAVYPHSCSDPANKSVVEEPEDNQTMSNKRYSTAFRVLVSKRQAQVSEMRRKTLLQY